MGEEFFDDDGEIYAVVINHEEQYSLWPVSRPTPRGWKLAGFKGTRPECLRRIEEVWTDMRPLILRQTVERLERQLREAEAKRPKRS